MRSRKSRKSLTMTLLSLTSSLQTCHPPLTLCKDLIY